jgi:hypothetical protein
MVTDHDRSPPSKRRHLVLDERLRAGEVCVHSMRDCGKLLRTQRAFWDIIGRSLLPTGRSLSRSASISTSGKHLRTGAKAVLDTWCLDRATLDRLPVLVTRLSAAGGTPTNCRMARHAGSYALAEFRAGRANRAGGKTPGGRPSALGRPAPLCSSPCATGRDFGEPSPASKRRLPADSPGAEDDAATCPFG